MARCPHCDQTLPADRRLVGARCPVCRDPLDEPAGRQSRPSRQEEASCAAHPGMESVGFCARCNRSLCEVCRTPWRGLIVCAACVDRALARGEAVLAPTGEAADNTAGARRRQGWTSLGFAGLAWLLGTLAVLTLQYNDRLTDRRVVGVTLAALALLAGAVLPAAAGVGQALATLRRGSAALALVGLVLGALYIGVVVAVATLTLWQT